MTELAPSVRLFRDCSRDLSSHLQEEFHDLLSTFDEESSQFEGLQLLCLLFKYLESSLKETIVKQGVNRVQKPAVLLNEGDYHISGQIAKYLLDNMTPELAAYLAKLNKQI